MRNWRAGGTQSALPIGGDGHTLHRLRDAMEPSGAVDEPDTRLRRTG